MDGTLDIDGKTGTSPSGLKETPADEAVTSNVYRVVAGELRGYVERWERLEENRGALAADQKDIMTEARDRGYDTKAIKAVIKLRRLSSDERAEADAVLDLYRRALGV